MEPLKKSWLTLRRRWPVLLGCLAIALVGATVYSSTQTKEYTASTELFLRAPDVKSSAGAYQGDLFSRQRAKTYINMFRSDDLAQLVIDKLGLTIPPSELVSKVHATTVKDTVLMVVSATDSDPQTAADIANAYGGVLVDYIAKIEYVGDNRDIPPLVETITTADAESAKVDGIPSWIMLGGALTLGLTLAIVAMWLLERFDTTVRSRRQVEEVTGNRVIGSLPDAGALVSGRSVSAAFDEPSDFSLAALRLSVNVETVLRDLPKVGVPPVVAVVAGHSGEGASVVARSLSRALIERGRAVGVVFVDPVSDPGAEARMILSRSGEAGVGGLLTTKSESVNVTAAGLETKVDELREGCDLVVLDLPPFAESVNAQIAIGVADAVLLAVRPNVTKITALGRVKDGIELLSTRVAGIVVNSAREAATSDGQYV